MDPADLLARVAGTLRTSIGPAVADEYPRTQAFMASVVLERVARELALRPAHREAERADVAALARSLRPVLAEAPPEILRALEAVTTESAIAPLAPLIDALYAWGPEHEPTAAALELIRPVLRRDIDRRMEIAR